MSEILNTDSPRWDEFVNRLEADIINPGVAGEEDRWFCDGDSGPDVCRYAKQVMAAMGNIDVPASIEFFNEHGGHCDCEIILNVDRFVRDSRMEKRSG